VFENIFAVGDVCLTRADEEKAVFPLRICAGVASQNMLKIASGERRLNSIPNEFPTMFIVTLGPEMGIFILNQFVKVGRDYGVMKT
jgi:hypothetical protein